MRNEWQEKNGMKHLKGKGDCCRYLVLWKEYPLHEATQELESHLDNAPNVLEEYLHHVLAQTRKRR